MTYRYHVSYERKLGNCAPSHSYVVMNTQRPIASDQDVQVIADLIQQSVSADLETLLHGQGSRTATGEIQITPDHRQAPGYRSDVNPNPHLKIRITKFQLLQ